MYVYFVSRYTIPLISISNSQIYTLKCLLIMFAGSSDLEMGPLHRSSPTPTTHDEDEPGQRIRGNGVPEYSMPLIPTPNTAEHRNNWHEAIEALILFSRALRAHDWVELGSEEWVCLQACGTNLRKTFQNGGIGILSRRVIFATIYGKLDTFRCGNLVWSWLGFGSQCTGLSAGGAFTRCHPANPL